MIPSVVAKQVRETVLDYLRTTFALADKDLERALFNFLDGPDGLFKGPYVDIRLPFRKREEGERIPLDIKPDFEPYKHQVKAFQRLYSKDGHQPQHTLVTTGTGSGKTECFLYPILDHCWRNRDKPGVKAIILYPMNALATDQAGRLAEILWDDERLKGEVSAGLYVGGQGRHSIADEKHLVDSRDVLRDSPPDILLTNYKMLDFLLLRPEDRRLWLRNESDTLRYLVLDELHTYDGAQGSDVACLIRRLKNRLKVEPGSLCCVGTSATIGDSDERSASALTNFASKVFDALFAEESLITESRQTPREALGGATDDNEPPYSAATDKLDPDEFADPQLWLEQQATFWLGSQIPIDPKQVAEALRSNHFLRQLLKVLGGNPQSIDEIDARLCSRDPDWKAVEDRRQRLLLLNSFLGLISYAKGKDGEREIPFLTVQVQLWLRELRRLVRQIADPNDVPKFAWASDHLYSDADDSHWLPIAYCRECGQSGFASLMRTNEVILRGDLPEIGKAWLYRSPSAQYVRVGKQATDLFPHFINPRSLAVGSNPTEQAANGETIGCVPALVTAELSNQVPPKSLARCPDCGGDHCLSMLGSRAPSLLSVAISDIFTSPYNVDKKLLAFTDSVQDASHRAGFFGARTYRFNVRTAIQGLQESEHMAVPLPEYAQRMFQRWLPEVAKERLVPTLMPPDLREYPRYLAFLESNGKGAHTRLQEDLIDRLSWEVTMEYGLRNRVGRTLEATRCSTFQIDSARLDKAAERLTLELNEESILDGRREDFEPSQIRHFLAGLLNRTRMRGGIFHPFLEPYIKSGGNGWLLRKALVPLMSPFGLRSVYPRFLTNFVAAQGAKGDTFDSIKSPTGSRTWLRDWASRCLDVPLNEPGTNELYKRVMAALNTAGLLKEFQGRSKSSVWGIDPKVVAITADTAVVACSQCGTEVVLPAGDVDHWDEQTCTMYRCKGQLSIAGDVNESYYSRIYKSGQLYRVFPDEHTGLLGRAAREDIEEAFRTQSRPNGPNLLVATPTLEMGIDIGDLSALVLCAVPPTTANFIQRVGRAGRKTGNALCLTLVNARPHDLYFFEAPEEMMSGAVVPPGCFLDTPEMLKRQLVAHGMDAWAREDEQAGPIPPQVRYIKKAEDPSKFPGRFIKYYRDHCAQLTESFLNRFAEELSTDNRQSLKEFGDGDAVPENVVGAFDRVRAERDELTKTRNRIREQIVTLEKSKEEVEDRDEKIKDLKFARAVIGRLIDEQGSKYPLNVLTDEGVLPNYAFPEAGVTLDSVIRDDKDDGQREFSSREFIRPASSAIRELAPFNTFYAEGRKVRIDEIDIGSSARPLTEKWRLCAECNYAERITDESVTATACPRCGDVGAWADAGQLRTLVNFRRSRSLASRLEASTVDDSDDREEEFYKTADLIDVAPGNCHGAQLISDLPFGYELLKDLKLREVNFGREFDGGGQGLKVAGMPIGDRGFDVCMDCGKVAGISAAAIEHAPYCKTKRTNQAPRVESVFLYRQIQSEAIRVLMPFADVSLDERRASFKAALELGFRRQFQGDPVHLQIKESREPVPGGGYRQYLVIFDAVPGGTGYLSELWRSANFMDVLQMALTALQSCECQKDERKDGCYRCLFAYQRQQELAVISSREAQRTLTDILGKRADLAPIQTLSEVSLDRRLESELEEKFIAALGARCQDQKDCTWREVVQGGEVRWQLSVSGCDWEIVAQAMLGSKQGVSVASKPDFLFKRINGGPDDKPIAIFCDGFAYHGCPGKEGGRIWDDVVKRQSLIDSGRFQKWSIAWKDVELFEKGKGSAPTIFESTKNQRLNAIARPAGLVLPREIGKASNMELFWHYLEKPDPEQWRCLANVWSVAWLASDPLMDPEQIAPIEKQLLDEAVVTRPANITVVASPGAVMGRAEWGDYLHTLMSCDAANLQSADIDSANVVMRLDDSATNRRANDFEISWRAFLQAWNLLQFRGNVQLQTSERIRHGGDEIVAATDKISRAAEPRPEKIVAEKPELAELLKYSAESVKPFLQHLASIGLSLPVLDFELDIGTGRCGPEPELSWPDLKIAILADNQLEDQPVFEGQGWKVFVHTLDNDALADEIRLRTADAIKQEEQ